MNKKDLLEIKQEMFDRSKIKENKKRKVKASLMLEREMDSRQIKKSIRMLKPEVKQLNLNQKIRVIKTSVVPEFRKNSDWYKTQQWAKSL